MSSITTTTTEQNSILLKKNSRGGYDWEIKIYFENHQDLVIERIKAIDKQLREKYLEVEK